MKLWKRIHVLGLTVFEMKFLKIRYQLISICMWKYVILTIFFLFRLMEESGVVFYCDFHAHSRKFNVFIYGCENRRHSEKYLREQIFPLMLHKNTAEKFSFEDCKYWFHVKYYNKIANHVDIFSRDICTLDIFVIL